MDLHNHAAHVEQGMCRRVLKYDAAVGEAARFAGFSVSCVPILYGTPIA
jgi:hypothetical protein